MFAPDLGIRTVKTWDNIGFCGISTALGNELEGALVQTARICKTNNFSSINIFGI